MSFKLKWAKKVQILENDFGKLQNWETSPHFNNKFLGVIRN